MKVLSTAFVLSTMLLASPVIGQQPTGRPEIPAGDTGTGVAHWPERVGSTGRIESTMLFQSLDLATAHKRAAESGDFFARCRVAPWLDVTTA